MSAPALNNEVRYVREAFVQECQSLSSSLTSLVVDLDRSPSQQETLVSLLRAMHTLKAAASSVPGADPISRIAHTAESVLSLVRDGSLPWSQSFLPVFLDATDKMIEAINEFSGSSEITIVADSVVSRLESLMPGRVASTDRSDHFGRLNSENSSGVRVGANSQPSSEGIYVLPSAIDALRDGLVKLIGISNQLQGVSRLEEIQRLPVNSHLTTICRSFSQTIDELSQRIADVRRVPLSRVGSRFKRVATETALVLAKQVDIQVHGDELKVDREVARALARSLDHIARNACDHGIEPADQRIQRGKSPWGSLKILFSVDQAGVTARVEDDGQGIDTAAIRDRLRQMDPVFKDMIELPDDKIIDAVFLDGLSTSKAVTDISGRGVGLSSARSELEAMGGSLVLSSRWGQGCRFELRVPHPRNNSITRAVIARSGSWLCAVAVERVVDISRMDQVILCSVNGHTTAQFRGKIIPLTTFDRISSKYVSELSTANMTGKLMLVLTHEGQWHGLLIDSVVDQLDVIIQPVSSLVKRRGPFVGVAAIPGNEIAFVLDPSQIIEGDARGK